MFDGEQFGLQMVEIVREYVAAELEPLRAENSALRAMNDAMEARLASVEAREMPDTTGLCDAEFVKSIVAQAIAPLEAKAEEVLAGQRAVDEVVAANTASLAERLAAVEAREIPEAVKGDPGEKGEPGADGAPGEVDMEAVKALVAETVADAVAALPTPEKGEPGAPGEKGEPGERGEPGQDGLPGKDGIGLANALKDGDGHLVLVLTDGSTRNLGPIDGKDGATFTLDDFDIEPLDERSIKLKFTNGDTCHSFELEFPIPIYRGVFSDNETYVRGDMVTWAGSLWHCNEPKGLKPGEPDSGFVMAAKKGRDGKS